MILLQLANILPGEGGGIEILLHATETSASLMPIGSYAELKLSSSSTTFFLSSFLLLLKHVMCTIERMCGIKPKVTFGKL